jgi:hypothetical protein
MFKLSLDEQGADWLRTVIVGAFSVVFVGMLSLIFDTVTFQIVTVMLAIFAVALLVYQGEVRRLTQQLETERALEWVWNKDAFLFDQALITGLDAALGIPGAREDYLLLKDFIEV